jgi:hypothetical protein
MAKVVKELGEGEDDDTANEIEDLEPEGRTGESRHRPVVVTGIYELYTVVHTILRYNLSHLSQSL